MTARIPYIAAVLLLVTHAAIAQQPGQAPKPAPKPAPGAPESVAPPPAQQMQQVPPSAERGPGRNQPINVRVEVTITEQRGKAAPNRKLLTIIAADGFRNAIRSQETFFDGGRQMEVPLNVDLTPVILLGQRAEITGKIRVLLNLEYDLPGNELKKSATGEFERTLTKSAIRENLIVILDDGKPMIVAQSADPVSDRQVTVEVRAAILK